MAIPRIVTARQIGLKFSDRFGDLGPEFYVTGHWTAGAVDTSDNHAVQMLRSYHREHSSKGWGGIGYHFAITRRGTLICLRPTNLKGAHVGMHNSNNVGVVMFGGAPGHQVRPSKRQMRTFRWLLANAHTHRLPAAHRTDRSLAHAKRFGHRDWDGHHSNACPGTFHKLYRSGGTAR